MPFFGAIANDMTLASRLEEVGHVRKSWSYCRCRSAARRTRGSGVPWDWGSRVLSAARQRVRGFVWRTEHCPNELCATADSSYGTRANAKPEPRAESEPE